MASDSGTSLHFDHVQALHDLVVAQLAKLAAVGHESAVRLSPGAHNQVVGFVLGDRHGAVDNVSNLVQELFGLQHDILRLLLLLFDLVVQGFRLGLLCRDVGFFVGFLFSSNCLGDLAFLSTQLVQVVLG